MSVFLRWDITLGSEKERAHRMTRHGVGAEWHERPTLEDSLDDMLSFSFSLVFEPFGLQRYGFVDEDHMYDITAPWRSRNLG